MCTAKKDALYKYFINHKTEAEDNTGREERRRIRVDMSASGVKCGGDDGVFLR